MPLELDPEVGKGMAGFYQMKDQHPAPAVGDVQSRRVGFEGLIVMLGATMPQFSDVSFKDFTAKSYDGHELLLRWYFKDGNTAKPTSAIFYTHGGGMICGKVQQFDQLCKAYVSHTSIPLLSVDYRLAPEHPHPTPIEDCYAGLVWLHKHVSELNVDPARIFVQGESAGGGLAAALAILARDRGGPAIAKQVLIYPMLSDTNTTPDPHIAPFALWGYDDNKTGWGALLGKDYGTDQVSPHAAPARLKDARGLPPAFIDVGDLDIFRDEDIEYALKLTKAGVPVELHVRPGCPHAYEGFAPGADVTQRATADRHRYMMSI